MTMVPAPDILVGADGGEYIRDARGRVYPYVVATFSAWNSPGTDEMLDQKLADEREKRRVALIRKLGGTP